MSHPPRDYPDDETEYPRVWRGDAVSGSGKDSRLDSWIQGGVLAGILALVAIVWTLRSDVTKIGTFVDIKAKQYDRDIERIERTLSGHDQRIADLERSQGTGQPHAEYRQER